MAIDPAKTPGKTAHEKKEERHSENHVGKFLRNFISVFQRTPRNHDQVNNDDVVPSPHVNVRELSSNKISLNLIVEKDRNLSHEGNGSKFPGKEQVDKTEVFLKQAENLASSKKGPTRSHCGDSSVENIPPGSESSDDESLPPPIDTPRVDNTIEIASQPISSGGVSCSPKPVEEVEVSTESNEIIIDPGNVVKQGAGPVNDTCSPKLPITDVKEE